MASDSKDYLKLSASQSRINAWYSLIETYCTDYAASSDFSKDGESDCSLSKGQPNSKYNYLTNDNNYFTLRIAAINNALGNGSGGDNGSSSSSDDNNDTPTAEILGYSVSGDTITFTFDPTMYPDIDDTFMETYGNALYVRGAFNEWTNYSDDKMIEDNGIWKLTVNKSRVKDNSEFKFWFDDGSQSNNDPFWQGAGNRSSQYAIPSDYIGNSGNIIFKY